MTTKRLHLKSHGLAAVVLAVAALSAFAPTTGACSESNNTNPSPALLLEADQPGNNTLRLRGRALGAVAPANDNWARCVDSLTASVELRLGLWD